MGHLQIFFFLFSLKLTKTVNQQTGSSIISNAFAGRLHHLLTVQFMAKSANFPFQVKFFISHQTTRTIQVKGFDKPLVCGLSPTTCPVGRVQ